MFGNNCRQCSTAAMAVCQVLPMIPAQPSQYDVDVAFQLSQTSELKNLTQAEHFSRGKASSCLLSTMVKSNEPEDTATSKLRTSIGSGPLQAPELELSMPGICAAQTPATAGSGIDVQGENFQASLGRHTDVIEECSISSAESGQLSLVGPQMKRIRSHALAFNTKANEIDLENEHLQLKCPSSIRGNGNSGVAVASSSDKELPWAHTISPVDWRLAMSRLSTPSHFSSQLLLSQQLTHGEVSKVGPLDLQDKPPTFHSHLFSASQCRVDSQFGTGTVMSAGLVDLEGSFTHGSPNYLLKASTSSNESTALCSNTGTIRDEMASISTGIMYGTFSEPITWGCTEVFGQNHSPTQLGKRNFAKWQLQLREIQRHVPRTDFQAAAFQENMSADSHNRIIGTCSVEGKQVQGLKYLLQRSTELVSNPNIGFGMPLAPVISAIHPNATVSDCPFAIQESPEMLRQKLTAGADSVMNVPFLHSTNSGDNLMCLSGPQAGQLDIFHSLHQRSSNDSGIQPRGGQSHLRNVHASAKDRTGLISDPNLPLLGYSKAPVSSTSAPLYSFPLSSANIASTSNPPVVTGGIGLKFLGLSNSSPDFGLPLEESNDPEVLPSITVVMEGRSIGGRICLQKLDGYESFALSMWEMFKNNIPGDGPASLGGVCNLSNAIPGFVIAYEDAEGDLLLAGDLPWRDFVRVAQRIRVVPAKKNKMKEFWGLRGQTFKI